VVSSLLPGTAGFDLDFAGTSFLLVSSFECVLATGMIGFEVAVCLLAAEWGLSRETADDCFRGLLSDAMISFD